MNDNSPTMEVKVFAPFKTYFEGQALSLSGVNDTGPFDVLPHHKNFMSLLKPTTPIVVRAAGKEDFKMEISRGVMHVSADNVTVFLDV